MTAVPKKRLTLNETESELKTKASKVVAAELVPAVHKVVHLNLVQTSPTNPRKHFDAAKLAELAADIRVHGVLQPLMVRPAGEKYELVFGERRLRAAREAGLAEVPVQIVELSDLEVVERQLVENDLREDLTPFERAEAYAALKKDHGLDEEAIAARVGRSASTVRSLLKLHHLGPEGLKWLKEGKLTASSALRLARVPKSLQAQVLKAAEDDYDLTPDTEHGDVPISDRGLRDLIRRDFMLELGKGKSCFDMTDATLVPDVGACGPCPQRTGADPGLHGEKEKDLCTNPVCYRQKEAAHLKREEEKGKRVLIGKAAEKVLGSGDRVKDNDFVRADSKRTYESKKTYEEQVDPEKIVLAQSPDGGIVKLIAKVDLPVVKEKPREKSDWEIEAEKRRKKDAAANALANQVHEKLMPTLLARLGKMTAAEEKKFWRWRLRELMAHAYESSAGERRGLKLPEVRKKIETWGTPELRAFYIEEEYLHTRGAQEMAEEVFGFDIDKLEAQVKAEAKAAEKTPPSGTAKKSGKKAA